ncbi:MAG: cytochrome c-type biogenesis protein CcmH [Acidimicrobiales bacterium]
MSPDGQRSAAGAPWAWALLAVALVAFVVIAAVGTRPPANDREAMLAVAETVKCPTCVGESVGVRSVDLQDHAREIADQLAAGRTPDEIRAYLAQNYGDVVLLDPGTEGVAVLVWVLPCSGSSAPWSGSPSSTGGGAGADRSRPPTRTVASWPTR